MKQQLKDKLIEHKQCIYRAWGIHPIHFSASNRYSFRNRQNMLPRIYLIRHGETAWSLARQAHGLYEQRGRRDGLAGQDWLEVEREIRKDETKK